MATRQSIDASSQNGISFADGDADDPVVVVKNVFISKRTQPNRIATNGVFSGHVVEVWADGAVFDTVTGKFLFPGRDFNFGDL